MRPPITWREVPGWFNFDDIYQEAVDRSPPSGATFLEVGVLYGKSTLFMAEAIRRSGKSIDFHAVDTFACAPALLSAVAANHLLSRPRDNSLLPELEAVGRERGHEAAARHAIELSGLGQYVHLHRESGQEAARRFQDASLNFAFVDARHTYDDTAGILRALLPKIAPGGVLAGHDYTDKFPGVKRAVQDVLVHGFEIKNTSFAWTK